LKYLLIAAGGGAGSLARFLVADAIMERYVGRFPLGTVAVNLSGSFVIGLLMTWITHDVLPHPNWRYALVVGFLGGYTTFSSFEWETYTALRHHGFWIGLANVVGSVGLGYLAVWLGAAIGLRGAR
jgi:CrcB protein